MLNLQRPLVEAGQTFAHGRASRRPLRRRDGSSPLRCRFANCVMALREPIVKHTNNIWIMLRFKILILCIMRFSLNASDVLNSIRCDRSPQVLRSEETYYVPAYLPTYVGVPTGSWKKCLRHSGAGGLYSSWTTKSMYFYTYYMLQNNVNKQKKRLFAYYVILITYLKN